MEMPLVVTYILTTAPLGNMLLMTFASIKRCSQRTFEFQLFHFTVLSVHYVVSAHHVHIMCTSRFACFILTAGRLLGRCVGFCTVNYKVEMYRN